MNLAEPHADSQRWPRYVYGSGAEPDYRFSFANERTYLAWVRTSVAFLDTVGKGGKGHAGWKTAAFLELEQSCDCGVGHRGHGRSCGERVKGAGGRDVGLQNERTALAWQRTALSLIVGSAVVSKVTFERLGYLSTISMAVAVPAAVWIFLDSRGRYRQRRSSSITTSPRNGAACRTGGGTFHCYKHSGGLRTSRFSLGLFGLVFSVQITGLWLTGYSGFHQAERTDIKSRMHRTESGTWGL